MVPAAAVGAVGVPVSTGDALVAYVAAAVTVDSKPEMEVITNDVDAI